MYLLHLYNVILCTSDYAFNISHEYNYITFILCVQYTKKCLIIEHFAEQII